MKSTVIAPSNIAFTKYWGKKDEILRLPMNGSIAMCLSNLLTTTTVEFYSKSQNDKTKGPRFRKDDNRDVVIINGEVEEGEANRVIKHLDRIRKLAGISDFAKVVSNNNFPTGTGLSSSSSGFAALTLAGVKAAGLNLSEKEFSILARQGSGSACRSIPSGTVEWLDGDTSETSYAKTIFAPDYWEIADVVAVVSENRKTVSTSKGHANASSSPFQNERVKRMGEKNKLLKKLFKNKDFTGFGNLVESEALELHAIYITQNPPIIYLVPNSILMMKLVQKWRDEGLECYFTINTGQDVHILVEKKNVNKLKNKLKQTLAVRDIIVNYPSEGARLSEKHLF